MTNGETILRDEMERERAAEAELRGRRNAGESGKRKNWAGRELACRIIP